MWNLLLLIRPLSDIQCLHSLHQDSQILDSSGDLGWAVIEMFTNVLNTQHNTGITVQMFRHIN